MIGLLKGAGDRRNIESQSKLCWRPLTSRDCKFDVGPVKVGTVGSIS